MSLMDKLPMSQATARAWRDLFDQGWFQAESLFDSWLEKMSVSFRLPWRMPDQARRIVEERVRQREANASLARESARLLSDFTQEALIALKSSVLAAAANKKWLKRSPRVSMPKLRAKDAPLRPKAHARNLELAWFVAERIVPFLQLVEGDSEAKLRPGRHGPKQGVPWDLLNEEWNRTHPHPGHCIESGRVFKDEYYRAIRNSRVARELLSRLQSEVAEAAESVRRLARVVAEGIGLRPELTEEQAEAVLKKAEARTERRLKRFWQSPEARTSLADIAATQQRLLELKRRTPPEEWNARERALRQRRRDNTARHDLLGALVSDWMLWKANTRGKTPRLEQPIRPWFLKEARYGDGPYDGDGYLRTRWGL